jgi:hypothetical protein
MDRGKTYDRDLRVIGQALEAKGIDVFELERRGDRYIVNGKPERNPSLLARIRDWRERMLGEPAAASINYSLADIERLEREGPSKRRKADRLPDFYSLSNTMRTLGFYLDSKDAELLRIQKRALTVTLLYQSKEGHPEVEEQSIASFYNLFLSLYDKRRKAAQG